MAKLAFLLVMLILTGCDSPVDFTPPPTPPPPSIPPEDPPRVDAPFSWTYYRGFTAFALQPEDTPALFAEALSHGWNTARVCSETEFWDEGEGAYPRRPRNVERVRGILEAAARIPGAQVLLIGDCTLKRQVPLSGAAEWAQQVAALANDYENVAIETHNEFANCRGRSDWGGRAEWCPGKQDVAEHIQIYRSAGIAEVTADDDLCWGPDEAKTYQFRLQNIGASPADFHPCRNTSRGDPWDPSTAFLEKVIQHNGAPILLSETVAWADNTGRCDGLSTCDQARIQAYADRCKALGVLFTFHSRELLAGRKPTWWPN